LLPLKIPVSLVKIGLITRSVKMSSAEESLSQEALDGAIKLLYSSRPARAAALLGLVGDGGPISLAPKGLSTADALSKELEALPSAEKLSMAGQGIPGGYGSPSGFMNQAQLSAQVSSQPINNLQTKIKKDLVGRPPSKSPEPIGDNNSSSSSMAPIAKVSQQLRPKLAMTEQELMLYQAGYDPYSAGQGHASGPALSPQQVGTLGAGAVGLAAANRMRAKNVAARELKNIRSQYLDAVQSGSLTRKDLRNLNKELKLRGAKAGLTPASTLGIADARMSKVEKDLTSKVLKTRYRGAMPLLLAGLLGTVGYNKLNEADHG
jgi:hypothetical protein